MTTAALPELVALALDAKHAHWNVTGPGFLSVHLLTDELANEVRIWEDRIAERVVALGSSVDGRPITVASVSTESLPAGRLADHEATAELVRRIGGVAALVRDSLDTLEGVDAVAHGIAVDTLEGLEKYRWMLHSAQA